MEYSKELNWLLQKAKENKPKSVHSECTEFEVSGTFRYSFILALKTKNKWNKELNAETNTTWWFGNRDSEKMEIFVTANIKTGQITFTLITAN